MAKNDPLEQFLLNVESFYQSIQTQVFNIFHKNQSNSVNKENISLPLISTKRGSSGPSSNKSGDIWTIWGFEREEKRKESVDYLNRAISDGGVHGTNTLDTQSSNKGKSGKPVSKEELGRVTWTLLHTIAAQFPDKPTKQQKRDVKELMAILSRIYPCKECADHFKEVIKANPVEANSGVELAQWMCRIHNVVNRSLAKPNFPCQRVDARWGALECDDGCDLQGRKHSRV